MPEKNHIIIDIYEFSILIFQKKIIIINIIYKYI